MDNPEFMTLAETAELLRFTPRSLQNKVTAGEIPNYRVGGKVLFDKKEVLDWIERSNQKRRAKQKKAWREKRDA